MVTFRPVNHPRWHISLLEGSCNIFVSRSRLWAPFTLCQQYSYLCGVNDPYNQTSFLVNSYWYQNMFIFFSFRVLKHSINYFKRASHWKSKSVGLYFVFKEIKIPSRMLLELHCTMHNTVLIAENKRKKERNNVSFLVSLNCELI